VVTLIKLVVRVLILAVLAWFGYATFVHVANAFAISDRLDTTGSLWAASDQARKAAAGGNGGLYAPNSKNPDTHGWNPIDSYVDDGTTLLLTTSYLTCARPKLVADTRVSQDVVVVIVHEDIPWLPTKDRFFPPKCAEPHAAVTVRAVLPSSVNGKVVVDGTTGASIQYKP